MSQETQIGNLSGGISDEDSRLVDSILNDINSSSGPGPGPGQQQRGQEQQGQQEQQRGQEQQQQQQLSPDQIKMIQQQQALRQQQMAQQQQAQQQMAQQQASVQQKMNMIQQGGSGASGATGDIMESVKLEAKNIMTIVFLCILFNIEQVDNLLKGVTMFVAEGGGLNMQAVFLKSILIGLIFYLVKTYLL
jgi:flagellar motor protein MotB